MAKYGFQTPENDRFYEFLITFDLESILVPIEQGQKGPLTLTHNTHRPVSVAIANNSITTQCTHGVTTHCDLCHNLRETVCFVNESPKELVQQFVAHLEYIQGHSSRVMGSKFLGHFRQLHHGIEKLQEIISSEDSVASDGDVSDLDISQETMESFTPPSPPNPEFERKVKKPNSFQTFMSNLCQNDVWKVDYCSDEENTENSSSDAGIEEFNDFSLQEAKCMLKIYKNFLQELEDYCNVIPVIGFNSGRYDHQLINGLLPEALGIVNEKKPFIVKRARNYACIKSSKFKFLDLRNFIAPGYSYDKLLKAFSVPQQKSYFAYEFVDSYEKLSYDRLPPVEAFHSQLKGCNVLGDDETSIASTYKQLEAIWEKEGMSTLKDWLMYYNKLDVGPLLQVCVQLLEFYKTLKIDVFKECLSAPSISRKLIFNSAAEKRCWFACFGPQHKHLHELIKANVTGGPSIVYCRYHKKNETFIKKNPNKICQACQGFDANSLYLYCLQQEMPVGRYICRHEKDSFRAEKPRDRYISMFDWLDYYSYIEKVKVHHKMNHSTEYRIGPYPIDGLVENSTTSEIRGTILQYHGCVFHGHECYLTRKIKDPKYHSKERQERADRTAKTTSFLKARGYRVIEKYECQWQMDMKKDPRIAEFLAKRWPTCFPLNKSLNAQEILNAVLHNRFFGLLLVDIETPSEWTREVRERDDYEQNFAPFTPREYFSEFSPLFVTSEIKMKDVGDFMQNYAQRENLSQKPRNLLVGGMSAQKVLLASPLVQWYLRHGMKITRIYQTIEYGRKIAFDNFTNLVIKGRREGMQCNSKVKADTFKLIG